MPKLFELSFKASDIANMPREDAVLLIQSGNLDNELSFLFRLITILVRTPAEQEFEHAGSFFQIMFLTRLIAGKLHEAWEMLKVEFFGSKLSKKYEPLLNDESKKRLKIVKKYFNKNNLVFAIRNEFAFHYDSTSIKDTLNNLDVSDSYPFYLGTERWNSLHVYAEQIISQSLLKKVSPDSDQALRQIVVEIVDISGAFIYFLNNLTVEIAKKYSLNSFDPSSAKEVVLSKEWKRSDLKLPYFFENDPEKLEQEKEQTN